MIGFNSRMLKYTRNVTRVYSKIKRTNLPERNISKLSNMIKLKQYGGTPKRETCNKGYIKPLY